MTRRRRDLKRHIQTTWLDAKGEKPRSPRGGKRRGAGRPPKGKRAGAPHKRRPRFQRTTPVHVTLRVLPVIGNLRRRLMYQALRWASLALAAKHDDCRIIHISVQRDHIHLLVEAENEEALWRGMKAFQVSAAKRLNAALRWPVRRRGQVFADRYHAEYITSPRQARNALAYVLNNWRKHREDRGAARDWEHDWFSSGWSFAGWRERAGEVFLRPVPETYQPMAVWYPRTWLLTTGWKRHGLIGLDEVPSTKKPVRDGWTARRLLR